MPPLCDLLYIPLFLFLHIIDAQFVYETRARLTTLDSEILNDPDANTLYGCDRFL